MEQPRRETIAELVRAGQSTKDIISLTGYPKSTVYRTIATVGAGGDVTRRSHIPRSDRKPTPKFMSGLTRPMQAKPSYTALGETDDLDEQACTRPSRKQEHHQQSRERGPRDEVVYQKTTKPPDRTSKGDTEGEGTEDPQSTQAPRE